MIYIGGEEIQNIYVGDSEISAIYAGEELIYPVNLGTLTGITIEGLVWVKDVPASGGTATKDNCSFRVVGHYDSDKSRTVTSKATVTGSLAVPATTAETREMVGVLQLTATYEGFTATGSVDVYQRSLKFEPTGYLAVRGGDNIIETNLNPYLVYTNAGNYMKFEINNDFNSICYLYNTTKSWFSFERQGGSGSGYAYMNIGRSTFLCQGDEFYETQGLTNTLVFTFNNAVATIKKIDGEGNVIARATSSWRGSIPNSILRLFPTSASLASLDFYRFKVFDTPDENAKPIYDFCPYIDNNNVPCIYDAANDTYFYKSGTGTITFIPFE